MKYRCKNPHDIKYGMMPIDDNDDVELMFGVLVSKESPFFIELHVEKVMKPNFFEMVESLRLTKISVSRRDISKLEVT